MKKYLIPLLAFTLAGCTEDFGEPVVAKPFPDLHSVPERPKMPDLEAQDTTIRDLSDQFDQNLELNQKIREDFDLKTECLPTK